MDILGVEKETWTVDDNIRNSSSHFCYYLLCQGADRHSNSAFSQMHWIHENGKCWLLMGFKEGIGFGGNILNILFSLTLIERDLSFHIKCSPWGNLGGSWIFLETSLNLSSFLPTLKFTFVGILGLWQSINEPLNGSYHSITIWYNGNNLRTLPRHSFLLYIIRIIISALQGRVR